MNRHAVQLIARGAINRMGNMLYDYGNSVWLASMGTVGRTVLGIYQISELVTSILINPFGGVISDRFSRRKILMTTDLVCGLLCLGISFIRNDRWMIAALIFANIVQAIAFAFSRTANKAIITEVVEKDEIVTYNAHLELVLQVIGVTSPVFSFLVLQFASLHATLLLDALTFFIAFVLVAFLPKEEAKIQEKKRFTGKDIFSDMKDGLDYIWHQKEIFFLLLVASSVNFFFAAFEFFLPFSNRLYGVNGAYATILTLGAIGSIIGALIANKFRAENLNFSEQTKTQDLRVYLGSDVKKFDFVIKTNTQIYLIETNFYNVGGSKLNEVARAYIEISQKISHCAGFKFVWITDGQGWLDAENKLEEAYKSVEIYNLANLDDFIRKIKND